MDIRRELAADWRAMALDYGERLGVDPSGCHLLQRADALDRGEDVQISSWELPRSALPARLADMPERLVLGSDGALRPVPSRSAA